MPAPHSSEQPALEPELAALASRLARLASEVAAFWTGHGLDLVEGGFHGTLDANGLATSPSDKGLIQQARHLWTWSMWFQRRDPSEAVAAMAKSAYEFMLAHFLDRNSREFAYRVDRRGAVLSSHKVLYAQSFAIYGLSEFSRVFHQDAAGNLALDCFRALDARAHDAAFLGYDQVNDAPWLKPGTRKETNTHLHLLEAFTTLYDVTADAQVRQRLEELLGLFTEKIFQASGYFHMEFSRDFRPLGPAAVSYGHDLETAWLLLEAARSLGRPHDQAVVATAVAAASNANAGGFDRAQGGYFEAGVPQGAASKLEKVWWVQAEALAGLWRLYELTRERSLLQRMNATLDYVERYLRRPSGEWLWGVLPDGSIGPRGDALGEEWKTAYHSLRALVYTEDWMRSATPLVVR